MRVCTGKGSIPSRFPRSEVVLWEGLIVVILKRTAHYWLRLFHEGCQWVGDKPAGPRKAPQGPARPRKAPGSTRIFTSGSQKVYRSQLHLGSQDGTKSLVRPSDVDYDPTQMYK